MGLGKLQSAPNGRSLSRHARRSVAKKGAEHNLPHRLNRHDVLSLRGDVFGGRPAKTPQAQAEAGPSRGAEAELIQKGGGTAAVRTSPVSLATRAPAEGPPATPRGRR